LPLIRPYELTNIAGTRSDILYGDNWNLDFRTLWDSVSPTHVNVSTINVENGIIYGYGTANRYDHFIIKAASGEEKTYKEVGEWEKQLRILEVDPNKVYDVLNLVEEFKSKGKLMWGLLSPDLYQQIKRCRLTLRIPSPLKTANINNQEPDSNVHLHLCNKLILVIKQRPL